MNPKPYPPRRPETSAKSRVNPRQNKAVDADRRRTRRNLRSRVSGKPGYYTNNLSLLRFLSMFVGQAFKIFVIAGLLLAFVLLGLGSGVLTGYISTAQNVEVGDLRRNMNNNETRVLDKDGNLVATLRGAGSSSEFVPFDEIRHTYLDDAFIAIEDERFESHPGIDTKRILSAVLSAVANGGTPTHGGSTITQQTIKLISGKDDISAQRKIQEWYNAVELEKTRSKDAIMELYLNLVPMANNLEGVQAASKYYFNKEAKDLNLAECALLAGIPNRPATYNPMTEFGRRNALRRMRLILGTMLEVGRITPEEYDEALNLEIKFDFSAQAKPEENIRNWFVDYVIQEVIDDLVTKKGYTPELASMAVYSYGLTIETTLDSQAQKNLEKIFQDETLFIKDPTQAPDTPEHPQAGITVMDNRPGEEGMVRAIVGGYGKKKGNMVFNFATDAYRQPGSSIKPILVYTPALEVGAISQATPLVDEQLFLNPDEPDEPYPLNYDRTYKGPVSLEYAILMSLNTIAADVYANRLGPEVGLSYLRESGIDRMDEPYVAGAMGGFTYGMTTFEMTASYSVLANDGYYTEPICYTTVRNQDGSILLDNTLRESRAVYNPATTYIMTQMLRKVAEATWNEAMPDNTIAAGKTGTTENFRDVWFCGYTPYYTAAVWYGYPNANGRSTAIPEIEGKNPGRIWRACMNSLHTDLPAADFARPEGVTNAIICKESGMLANEFCPETIPVLLIDGSPANPTEICHWHAAPPPTEEDKDKKDKDKKDENDDAPPEPIVTPPIPPPLFGDSGFQP